MFNNNLPLVLTVWMMVILLMMIARKRKHTAGVGLVLAYVLNLWLIHWATSLIYLFPWYRGPYADSTTLGAEISLYAVIAFAFGSVVFAPFLLDTGLLPRSKELHHPDPRLPRAYLLVGAFFYILLSTA